MSKKYGFSIQNLSNLGISLPVSILVLVASALVFGALLVSQTQPVQNTQVLGAQDSQK